MFTIKFALEDGKVVQCFFIKDDIVWDKDVIDKKLLERGISIPQLFKMITKKNGVVDAVLGGCYKLESICALHKVLKSVNLRRLLESKKGYFFLPVCLTLMKHLDMSAATLARELLPVSPTSLHFLEDLNPKLTEMLMRNLTLDTIRYCVSHLDNTTSRYVSDLLPSVYDNTPRGIRELNFPVVKDSYSNLYLWNPAGGFWRCMDWNRARFEMTKIYEMLGHPGTKFIDSMLVNCKLRKMKHRVRIDEKLTANVPEFYQI